MLPSSREIVLHVPISRMALADENTLHVIDNNCALHKIDLNRLEILKSTTLSSSYIPSLFDYYQRPVALGAKKAYVSFNTQGSEYIIDTRTKLNKICNFSHNAGMRVTKARFGEKDKILITGNEKGRTFIIDADDGHLITELPRSSDTITAVTLYDDAQLAARASFSKRIIIYSYSKQEVIFQKQLEEVVEMMTFVSENILLAITRNGKIIKIDIAKQRIVKQCLLNENLWPSYLTLSHSKKFIYIGTRESVLFALHVKSLEVLFSVKLPYIGITSFIRSSRYFIFGFKSGEILFINHREFEDQFKLYIKLKKIKEASILFTKNIFLMSHRDTSLIYDEWLVQKETIINLISSDHFEEAKEMAEPFLFHPKCKLEFAQIEELQPDLMSLNRYFRSFHFAPAYELASNKPILKKSAIFAQMEAIWNKNLQKAQILLSREPLINKEAARDCLKLFLDVEEKKVLIEQMLHNSKIFMLSESAIRDKNFALYFKMVAQNSFLEFTPLYKKVLILGEKLQLQINKLLEDKEYMQALSLTSMLHDFLPYQNQAARFKEVSNALSALEYQISHNLLFEAIKIQDQFQLGSNYEPIRTLEELKKQFYDTQLEAIEAKKYPSVYAALLPFMSIAVCSTNISFLMRRLYIAQFNDAYNECSSAIDWEKSLSTYLHFFGPDGLIKAFALNSNLDVILEELNTESHRQERLSYPKDLLILKS